MLPNHSSKTYNICVYSGLRQSSISFVMSSNTSTCPNKGPSLLALSRKRMGIARLQLRLGRDDAFPEASDSSLPCWRLVSCICICTAWWARTPHRFRPCQNLTEGNGPPEFGKARKHTGVGFGSQPALPSPDQTARQVRQVPHMNHWEVII